MKVTTNKKEKVFEPIELTITIENIDELKYLCAMFDDHASVINTNAESRYKFDYNNVEGEKNYNYFRDLYNEYLNSL